MATESLLKQLPPPLHGMHAVNEQHERAIDPLIVADLQSVSSSSFELQLNEIHSQPQAFIAAAIASSANNSTPQQFKSMKHQQQQHGSSHHNLSVTSSGGALSTTSTSSSNGGANSRFSAIRNWLKQNRWRKQKDKSHSTSSTVLAMGSPNSTPISNKNSTSLIGSLTSPFNAAAANSSNTNNNNNKKSNSDNKHYKTGSNVSTPNNNVKTQLNSKYLVLFLLIFPFLFPFFFFINSISTTLFFSLPLFQLLIIIIIFLVSNLGGFFLCVLLQFMNSFVLFLID